MANNVILKGTYTNSGSSSNDGFKNIACNRYGALSVDNTHLNSFHTFAAYSAATTGALLVNSIVAPNYIVISDIVFAGSNNGSISFFDNTTTVEIMRLNCLANDTNHINLNQPIVLDPGSQLKVSVSAANTNVFVSGFISE